MSAYRPGGAALLKIAAMGNRSDVLYDYGTSFSSAHMAKGVDL